MTFPYSSGSLDDLLNACIEFSDAFRPQFATWEICGRHNVDVDADAVRQMMDWVVALDSGLLVCSGMALDNITYFRLGPNARIVMERGGFVRYMQRRRLQEHLTQLKEWSPIGISLLAILIATLAWLLPRDAGRRVDALERGLRNVQGEYAQTRSTVVALDARVDTLMARRAPMVTKH